MEDTLLHSTDHQDRDSITTFAETNFRHQKKLFGIRKDDRRRHMYLVGKTGMGKSVTLEQMIYSDIQAGNGLALVDPHGDLGDKILDFIPNHRVNDVIYFNPADLDYPIAFNILENVEKDKQHLIASGLIGIFKKIWAESWGPRLEYVLRNAILALLDYEGSTLLGVMRILVDKGYRNQVIKTIKDPVVRAFWVDEYSRYPDKFQAEAIAPIQNKVGQFLSNSLVRNIIGQVKSSINIRELMDNKKILIFNLSKGRVGEDTAALLGAMMITKIQLAAMERIELMEQDRADFYLYVDEFQNFATDSFANILSEARKYRLCLIMAHQYVEQLNDVVRPAVFGNVGTIVCFRVGAVDAEMLVKEFTPRFLEEDLVNLGKYEMYLKLMINGIASEPFSANTLPPVMKNFGNREKIIKVSRERYSKPREDVEEKILRWAENQNQPVGGARDIRSEVKIAQSKPLIDQPGVQNSLNRRFEERPDRRAQPSDMRNRGNDKPVINTASVAPKAQIHQSDGYIPNVKRVITRPARAESPTETVKAIGRSNIVISDAGRPVWYPAICAQCSAKTEVPFPLDGKKIPYCKKCLKNVQTNVRTSLINKNIAVQIENQEPLRAEHRVSTLRHVQEDDNTPIKKETIILKKLAPGEVVKIL